MTALVLDGRKVAASLQEEVASRVESLSKKGKDVALATVSA